jgi:hypothetical protein
MPKGDRPISTKVEVSSRLTQVFARGHEDYDSSGNDNAHLTKKRQNRTTYTNIMEAIHNVILEFE